ncbi:ferredoxin Fer [Haloferacaceae archaeon DSL9]
MVSPFAVLQIDPGADADEIERAYRRRVKETHPDLGGSAEEFQLVIAAYEDVASGSPSAQIDVDSVPDPDERADARVEYLNYEVLDDYGWALDDDDLFEKAADAGLDRIDYGELVVDPNESILEAAEGHGFVWPYACRGGACANCAVTIADGELRMPADHILPSDMVEAGIGLSCNGTPSTDEMKIVYNIKNRPDLEDLRLPPDRFDRAHPDL